MKKNIFSYSFVFFICFLFNLYQSTAYAQEYLGFGIHLSPPIKIDNCCNAYVEAKPTIIPSGSFTFKKIWKNENGKEWYYEVGATSMGISANVREYPNDSTRTWGKIKMTHVGFPSILFGVGRVYPFGKSMTQDFSLGLEGSYRIAHDVIIESAYFGLEDPVGYDVFPLFLRINAGYGARIKLLRNIPIYIQAYTNLSFQNIIRAPQYLANPVSGHVDEGGKYRLNNSEIGLKIFANTDVNYNKLKWEKRKKRIKTGLFHYRLSLEGQVYIPPATDYYIPQVDSFSLTGLDFSFSNQFTVKSEFPHSRNEDWATIAGLGIGVTTITTHFQAIPSFTREGREIDSPKGSFIGLHMIPVLGLGYKHPIGKSYLQHSFSTSFVIPITKDNDQIAVIESLPPSGLPPELWTTIVRGEVDYKYGRDKVLFGLEYQPELLFHLDERFFYGIGLVFNYSEGLIAHGWVKVENGRTKYFGAIFQNFSKIGITARIGWNSTKRY